MICKAPFFLKKLQIPVPCGKCVACRVRRREEWTLRLQLERLSHETCSFVTLTYAEEWLPHQGTLVKRDLQNFFKRLRKMYPKPIRYFACGEYGDQFGRPHYHAIIFGLSPFEFSFVSACWRFGIVDVRDANIKNMRYVAGYVSKKFSKTKQEFYDAHPSLLPEFCLSSRRPGLGVPSLELILKNSIIQNGDIVPYLIFGDKKVKIPRFVLNKMRSLLFTSEYLDTLKNVRISLLREFYRKLTYKHFVGYSEVTCPLAVAKESEGYLLALEAKRFSTYRKDF